jgi:hypothetical protein
LPLLFKFLLPGQEDCVFFSGHLSLHAKPETGIPYREKIITIKLKKTEDNSKWFHPSDNREILFYSHNTIYLRREHQYVLVR